MKHQQDIAPAKQHLADPGRTGRIILQLCKLRHQRLVAGGECALFRHDGKMRHGRLAKQLESIEQLPLSRAQLLAAGKAAVDLRQPGQVKLPHGRTAAFHCSALLDDGAEHVGKDRSTRRRQAAKFARRPRRDLRLGHRTGIEGLRHRVEMCVDPTTGIVSAGGEEIGQGCIIHSELSRGIT